MRKISRLQQVIYQVILFFIGLYIILPIWGILRLAFDGSLISRPIEFRLFPKTFSMESFLAVLDRPYQSVEFSVLLKNSMIVSVGSAVLALLLGGLLAYSIARFTFTGRKVSLFIILLTALLPPIAFAVPLYLILSYLKIRTTLIGLMLVYTVFAMPFCVWNLRAGFQSVAKELEEAAFLDGANHLQAFWKIILPLALPTIAVTALIAFLMAYSEFAIGWMFVEKASTVTLAMSIYAMVTSGNAQPWSMLGSLVIIMSLPVIVVFVFLQRTLLESMTFGGIKK